MNVSELQNLVNYRRRDLTETFISNDEILAYLNEGNRKVTSEYEFESNKVSTSFQYTSGTIQYAMSAIAPDFDEMINVFHTPSEYFNVVSPEEFMRLSSNNYNIIAVDGIYLLAKTTFGDGTLSMNYYTNYTAQTSAGSLIAKMSASDDSPLIPYLSQDLLVDFAAARCYQKEGMYDDYQIAWKDYLKGVSTLKAKVPSRKKHNPTRWQSPRKGGVGTADNMKSDPLNQL